MTIYCDPQAINAPDRDAQDRLLLGKVRLALHIPKSWHSVKHDFIHMQNQYHSPGVCDISLELVSILLHAESVVIW